MAPARFEAAQASTGRARIAVAALFFTNGALFAALLPRYPEIKADLALSNTAFGIAVAAFSGGAFMAGITAGALIRRWTSARVGVAGTLGIAVFVLLAGLAPVPALFTAAMFVAGASDAVTDVAQNAHALRVQRHYGRSIINSFHAVWAAGAISGGLLGSAAIALGMPRAVQLAGTAVLFSAVVLIAYRWMLPGPDHDEERVAEQAAETPAGLRVYAILGALAMIAIAGAVVEDAGSSWATLYLHDSLGAAAAVAPLGYVALVACMFVGRLFGDRLVDRFGEAAVVRAGGFVTAAGMGAALAVPTVPTVILGFAAAGLGVAALIPAAMHGADRLPGLRPGTGLTLVTWLLRIGFLASPPVVGLVADAAGLRVGLLVVPLAGVTTVLLAGALSARARRSRS
jgi:fucose permease